MLRMVLDGVLGRTRHPCEPGVVPKQNLIGPRKFKRAFFVGPSLAIFIGTMGICTPGHGKGDTTLNCALINARSLYNKKEEVVSYGVMYTI